MQELTVQGLFISKKSVDIFSPIYWQILTFKPNFWPIFYLKTEQFWPETPNIKTLTLINQN